MIDRGPRYWRQLLSGGLLTLLLGCAGGNGSVLDHARPLGDAWMAARFVGVVPQAYATSCAAAAASTVLSIDCGRSVTEARAIVWMLEDRRQRGLASPAISGFSLRDILRLLRSQGLEVQAYRGDVDDFVRAGRPVLVRVVRAGIAHFTVVVGMDDRRVYLADSIDGRISVTRAEFAAWRESSPYFLVVDSLCDHRAELERRAAVESVGRDARR